MLDSSAGARPSVRYRGVALVLTAGALYSTAGLFTRAVAADGWTVLAWRSLFGALFMVLLVAWESRRFSLRDYALDLPHALLVPCTALGTACYVFALKVTSVADVMIVYATTPFVTAGVAWLWTREVPTGRTLAASALALLGVGIMIGAGGASQARLLGSLLTLVMNVGFGLTLVLARRRPDISMTPVNALGVLLAAVVAFAVAPVVAVGPSALLVLAAFGVFTIGFAMWLFMAGARLLPPAETALIGISDTVMGPVLVWLVFGENPGPAAIVGGGVVLAALLVNLWPDLRRLLDGRSRAMI